MITNIPIAAPASRASIVSIVLEEFGEVIFRLDFIFS
jgi:hypothetical protein